MSDTVEKPNLFNYATKELSQDAFLCWLIAWADEKYKGETLHEAGKVFLKSLLAKVHVTYTNLTKIEIETQSNKIDVLVLLELDGKNFALIIEDKIHTSDHGNQLERYKNSVKEKYKDHELKCIYFKTGDSSNHKGAEKNGYEVYLRQDFLEALKDYKDIDSDIFQDFYKTMTMWEGYISEFKTKAIKDWTGGDFKGLYIELSQGALKDMDNPSWEYVSNPSGGFMACTWNWKWVTNKGFGLYFQIQSNKKILAFRSSEIDTPERMRQIHSDFIKFAHANDCHEVVKPRTLRYGKSCNIAVVECKDWLGADSDTYNADFVAKNIEKYTKLHADFIEYYKNN